MLQSGPGLCVNFDVMLLSVSYVNTTKVLYQNYEVTFYHKWHVKNFIKKCFSVETQYFLLENTEYPITL